MKISLIQLQTFMPSNKSNFNTLSIVNNLLKAEGFFNELLVVESEVNKLVEKFRMDFDLITTKNLKTLIIEKLYNKINNGNDINIYEDVYNVFKNFCETTSISSMLGFDNLPEIPEELSPIDFKEVIINCLDSIFRCNNQVIKASMKKTFFQSILPNMFTYIMNQMTFLEELEGEEFNTLFDELDELGYTFITALKINNGMVLSTTDIDQYTTSKLGCTVILEHSTFVKYVYERSLSPWTFMMTANDFNNNFENLLQTNPKEVLSSVIEWQENFKEVQLTREVTNENMQAIKRFLCI
jgi:hypothetical protein